MDGNYSAGSNWLAGLPPRGIGATAGDWVSRSRAEYNSYYGNAVANATNPLTAALARTGRALSNAPFDLAQGAVGIYTLATDPSARARAIIAIGNAVLNPVQTANYAIGTARGYVANTSLPQMAEDATRVGATSLLGATTARLGGLSARAVATSDFQPVIRPLGGRGPTSGREFDAAQAGGPIRQLSTQGVRITARGIEVVERHTIRFGPDDANAAMIDRLRRISRGQLDATQYDINYYTHELREYTRYRRQGWETGQPSDPMAARKLWNDAHSATLEEYRLRDSALYHPEVFQR